MLVDVEPSRDIAELRASGTTVQRNLEFATTNYDGFSHACKLFGLNVADKRRASVPAHAVVFV